MKPMLAQTYGGKLLPGTWYAEAKADGFRAIFDGQNLCLRSGRKLTNPPEVLAELRARFAGIALDGELYGESWNHTAGVTKHAPTRNSGILYHVFDLPSSACLPLKARKQMLCGLPFSSCQFVRAMPWYELEAGDRPELIAAHLATEGAEGAVLKYAESAYLQGIRTPFWLKVKALDTEMDATIVGAECASEGRLASSLAALTVEGGGFQYRVGSGFSDQERANLWTLHQAGKLLGSVVTVKFQKDAAIRGRFPRLVGLRLREDL